MVLYMQGGYLSKTNEDRVYIFLLSVSNPTDSNNSVAKLDLRIKYTTDSGFQATVDVPSVSGYNEIYERDTYSELEVPVIVDAHKTVVGRAFFPLKHALVKSCLVDAYEVIATDSHGSQTSIEVTLVQEIVNEAELKKN